MTYRFHTLPVMLCAAAVALPGCSTDRVNTTAKPSPPSVERNDAFEEVIVTGSRVPDASPVPQPQPVVANQAEAKQYRQERDGALNAIAPAVSVRDMSVHAPPYLSVQNRENYAVIERNSVTLTRDNPVSTFSVDVDTGAYANVRRFLNNDQLPPQDAVRVEELINYFDYDYPTPDSSDVPFSVNTELSRAPWSDNWLLQIGLKGYEVPVADRPAANLVFLLDVSGSMNSANKLPLLKKSFRLLTQQLNERDRISIVVYAGASGVVLEPTAGDNQRAISRALRQLQAGGSTNGAAGIRLAYQLAEEAFIEDGINRIVLATDGDFNVGTVDFEALKDLAERKRQSGVSLTTLGFGSGNYNDHLMEQLADAGNGNYAYIDSQKEARKVLVNEITSTLHTIAKDVKIQIEFNPAVVAEYRLIGYENRALNREDFINDRVDAGEIGAGHTVTALYELVPVSSSSRSVHPLRYQAEKRTQTGDLSAQSEIGFIRLRYKQPHGDISTEIGTPVRLSTLQSLEDSTDNLRFSAAVAAFGQLLCGDVHTGRYGFDDVEQLARGAIDRDPHGYRHEFVDLVNTADMLFDEQGAQQIAVTD